MRKITKESVNAFFNNYKFNSGNMSIVVEGTEAKMYLHGNLIARKDNNGTYITNSGWQSNTTKERLNGILSRCPGNQGIYQKNWEWYLNDKQWDGSWIKVA